MHPQYPHPRYPAPAPAPIPRPDAPPPEVTMGYTDNPLEHGTHKDADAGSFLGVGEGRENVDLPEVEITTQAPDEVPTRIVEERKVGVSDVLTADVGEVLAAATDIDAIERGEWTDGVAVALKPEPDRVYEEQTGPPAAERVLTMGGVALNERPTDAPSSNAPASPTPDTTGQEELPGAPNLGQGVLEDGRTIMRGMEGDLERGVTLGALVAARGEVMAELNKLSHELAKANQELKAIQLEHDRRSFTNDIGGDSELIEPPLKEAKAAASEVQKEQASLRRELGVLRTASRALSGEPPVKEDTHFAVSTSEDRVVFSGKAAARIRAAVESFMQPDT